MTRSPEDARTAAILFRVVFFCLLAVFVLEFFDDRSLLEVVIAIVLQATVLGGLFYVAFTTRGRQHLGGQPTGMPKTWRARILYVVVTAVIVVVMSANNFAFGEDSRVATSTALAAALVAIFFSVQLTYKLDAKWSGGRSSSLQIPPSGEHSQEWR